MSRRIERIVEKKKISPTSWGNFSKFSKITVELGYIINISHKKGLVNSLEIFLKKSFLFSYFLPFTKPKKIILLMN